MLGMSPPNWETSLRLHHQPHTLNLVQALNNLYPNDIIAPLNKLNTLNTQFQAKTHNQSRFTYYTSPMLLNCSPLQPS
jgi:hypothetical protein